METYNGWILYDSMPDGFRIDKTEGSPLAGYKFIINGSPLNGGARALLRMHSYAMRVCDKSYPIAKIEQKKNEQTQKIDENYRSAVNALARKKFEMRLLADIKVDLMICEIEGWDKREYIDELKLLINGLVNS